MRCPTIALAACVFALPVRAQLTTTYSGTQLVGDHQVPATAQFTVENGRVVAVMTGARAGRLIYDAQAEVLHIVSDEEKSYFDITKSGAASGDPMGMSTAMQKQLEKMPKEQRAITGRGHARQREGHRVLRLDVGRLQDERRRTPNDARHAGLPAELWHHGEIRQ